MDSYMYISVRFRSLRNKTKLPDWPTNLKYWRDRYSNDRWDGYDVKVGTLFKYSKDEFIKKIEESVDKKDERVVTMKIELIIQHKDHFDSIMLYDYSAWNYGRERPGKWISTQQELDQLVATIKNV